jgi:hypothetical protein
MTSDSHILPSDTTARSKRIAFRRHWQAFCAADESGKNLLWVRSLDSLTARSFPGTEEQTIRSGRWIAGR